MPSGANHFKFGLVSGAAIVFTFASFLPQEVMPALKGIGIALIVTPDLDQERVKTFTEELLYGIWWVFGMAFEFNWFPYGAVCKHRGVSHSVAFGTLTRVVWSAVLMLFWATVATGAQDIISGEHFDWIGQVVLPIWNHASVTLFFVWWLMDSLAHLIPDAVVGEHPIRWFL